VVGLKGELEKVQSTFSRGKWNLQRFTSPHAFELERELEKVHFPGEGRRGRGNLKRFTLPIVVGLKGELEKVRPSVAGKGTCKGSLSR